MATVTFLFVDQVGSTEQLRTLGDAATVPVREPRAPERSSNASAARMSWADHWRFHRVASAELLVPFAAAVADGLDDASVFDLAEPEAARRQVLAAHVLMFLVFGHESRDGRNRAQHIDPNVALVYVLELGRERSRALKLHSPHGHVQVEEGVGREDVLSGVGVREDVRKPLAQSFHGADHRVTDSNEIVLQGAATTARMTTDVDVLADPSSINASRWTVLEIT